ncbi:MAG: NIPSNAP family protein [Burkholderiales bacterium]|nr:NIPSNAP family protein [Burkholderiales bacterium]
MLMTLRTWRVQRRDHAEFARISEEQYWPEFDRLDGRALGMWAIRVGAPERLMIMTRYESLEHWLGTRAWGASAEPLKALAERRDRMFDDTAVIAMLDLSRRQPAGDAPEPQPGVYILEQFRAKLDDMEHFRELTEDVWAPWAEAEGGVRLVGMWRSYIGPQDLVHVLTRADDFGVWEARHAIATPCARALEERAAMSARTSVQLLYSVTRRRP